MLKIRCLILDHDDTLVDSERTINYPALYEYLKITHPEKQLSREIFDRWCFYKSYNALLREYLQLTPQEEADSFRFWQEYAETHTPPVFEGWKELLTQFKTDGGKIFVSSLSACKNITRDYLLHIGFLPDDIYGCDLGEEKLKPSPFALLDILKRTGLKKDECLMIDDMKPGFDMAKSAGVPFACAGWSHYIPDIREYMENNCTNYLNNLDELKTLIWN